MAAPPVFVAKKAVQRMAAPPVYTPQKAVQRMAAPPVYTPQKAVQRMAAPPVYTPQKAVQRMAAPPVYSPQKAVQRMSAPPVYTPQTAAQRMAAPAVYAPQGTTIPNASTALPLRAGTGQVQPMWATRAKNAAVVTSAPPATAVLPRAGLGQRVVQRRVEWRPSQQTHAYDHIAAEIDKAVQNAAAYVLNNPMAPEVLSVDGYTKRWGAAYRLFRDQGDLTFLPATFGYAVESVACKMFFGPVILLASHSGLRISLQATRGGSRPDVVLKNSSDKDVAWFDITSEGSVTHIDRKNSTKWLTLGDVAEICYPKLDETKLARGASSVQEQTDAIESAAEMLLLKQKYTNKIAWLAAHLPAPSAANNMAERRNKAENDISALFGLTKKIAPTTAKSLLELGNKKLSDYGYKGVYKQNRNREAALELLLDENDMTVGDADSAEFNNKLISVWNNSIMESFDPSETPLFDTGESSGTGKRKINENIPSLPLRMPKPNTPPPSPPAAANTTTTFAPPLSAQEEDNFVNSFLDL